LDEALGLIWSPILTELQKLANSSQLRILVSPFCSRSAVERVIETAENPSAIQVITRWNASDIVTGVADLSLFPFLRDLRVPLYIHPRIHLKLYVFDSNRALHTSGNATNRGLGIVTDSHIEVGAVVELSCGDWRRIFQLLEESVRVDERIYSAAEAYRAEHQRPQQKLPTLDLRPEHEASFSVLALPQSSSPQVLHDSYFAKSSLPTESLAAYSHDLVAYDIPDGLSESVFYEHVDRGFRGNALVRAIVDLIRTHESARFGLVKEWLQQNCSDKPTPYRRDLTDLTRNLYSWLTFFYAEITWDTPNHSMVLRWKGK